MIVASVTLPLRHTYIQKPIRKPSGIVTAIVKTPHGLSESALTRMMPRPASVMMMMNRMAIAATRPATEPISCLTMSGSERPPRRTDAHRMTESCTAPARQTPATNHNSPGA